MTYKILIDEDAICDIREAAEWYENVQKGLGNRFTAQVKSQITGLKKMPFAGSFRTETTRSLLVKKFPFIIYYVVAELKTIVEIHAVLHTSRNPEIRVSRIK
jgi:plasmid stabilization system protein ParE